MQRTKYYLKKAAFFGLRKLRRLGETIKSHRAVINRLPGGRKTQSLINRYKLLFGVGSAIVICLFLTVFSVLLYVVTGTSKLDLSRPGYEGARQKVTRTSANENSFGATGALDRKTVDAYLEKYKKQSQALGKYDHFDPKLLDDGPLGIGPAVIAPSDGASPPQP